MPAHRDHKVGRAAAPQPQPQAPTGGGLGGPGGATAGAMSERPNSTYRQFVQRCASEKGLDIIGWN